MNNEEQPTVRIPGKNKPWQRKTANKKALRKGWVRSVKETKGASVGPPRRREGAKLGVGSQRGTKITVLCHGNQFGIYLSKIKQC